MPRMPLNFCDQAEMYMQYHKSHYDKISEKIRHKKEIVSDKDVNEAIRKRAKKLYEWGNNFIKKTYGPH